MASDSAQEKTESATAKKRSETRNRGSVAKSTEVTSVFVLAAALAMFQITGPAMMENLAGFLRRYLTLASTTRMDITTVMMYFNESWWLIGKVCLPFILPIMVVGLIANYLQVGWLFTLKPIMPKFSKLNPITGFQRLFSVRSLVETAKSSLKIIIISLVVYITVSAEYERFLQLANTSVGIVWLFVCSVSFKVILRTLLVLLVLAILDYMYQKFEYEKSMKMSKEEVKEERKQMEGDPQIKGRIRRVQNEMARRRMMQEVPKATVVVTNPTYIAIAMQYESETMTAPKVLAKGKRLVAERIRAIATENGIPIVEDKPLARAMYDKVQPGDSIPAEFFTAVAQIMAYVYRLKNRMAA